MIITNKFNLPDPIVTAVSQDIYSKGASDISISELISPPRARTLIERHKADITQDVSDLVWSLVGQIGHGILQRSSALTAMSEKRLITNIDGWRVSGQLDHYTYDSMKLVDWKFTTFWRLKDGVPEEWKEQLNSYAYLLKCNDYPVSSAQILAVYRDWSVSEAGRNPTYPQKQVELFDVPLWPEELQLYFIRRRLELHKQAQDAPEELLPECSPQERWQRRTIFQCIRQGNKKATKVFTNESDAHKFVSSQKVPSEFSIVRRLGEPIRCKHYCLAAPFCTQWQKEKPLYEPLFSTI